MRPISNALAQFIYYEPLLTLIFCIIDSVLRNISIYKGMAYFQFKTQAIIIRIQIDGGSETPIPIATCTL